MQPAGTAQTDVCFGSVEMMCLGDVSGSQMSTFLQAASHTAAAGINAKDWASICYRQSSFATSEPVKATKALPDPERSQCIIS